MPKLEAFTKTVKKMTFKTHQSRLRTVRQGDQDFMLNDGLIISPRAGFEINSKCPREYKDIIRECIDNAWLKPVATMYDYEQTFDRLKNSEQ